jgi:hypothetical protein
MQSFDKQPGEVLDYDVSAKDFFKKLTSDRIQSVAITVRSDTEAAPTLVVGPLPHPEYVLIGATPIDFKVWLGGGTDFTQYVVQCVVTTLQDRLFEIEFKIKVREK